jgi:hypothetical protein
MYDIFDNLPTTPHTAYIYGCFKWLNLVPYVSSLSVVGSQIAKDIKYIAINRVPLVNLVLLDLLTE